MIKILVDSASDIDSYEAEALGLELIPIEVRFGEEQYFDGVNLTRRQFFEKLIKCEELPKTSQINEYRWEQKFSELTADGSEVIAITLSSKLSGTYSCAAAAACSFEGKVRVVDSLNACIGERILCMYALRLRESLTADEIVKELDESKNKIQLLALLDTLKYLKMGGRISSAAALAGGILSVKPVVSVTDGEVRLAGKALGSKKGNNLLMRLVQSCGGINFDLPYALGYSGLGDECLKRYLADSRSLWEGKTDCIPQYMIGSTIGTHVGPGAIAVAFFAK